MGFAVFIAAKYIREPHLIRCIFARSAMAINPHWNNGLLLRAIGISLLLHVLVLLQPGFEHAPLLATPPQILTALIQPAVKKAAGPRPEMSSTAARRTKPVSREGGPPAEASPVAPQSPISSETEPGAAEASAVAAAAQSSVSSVVAPRTSVASVLPENSEPDLVEAKKSYLFALAAAARREKKYPRRALAAGWSGTAEVRVSVSIGGNVQVPQLQKASGYADIDNAALSLIGLALKQTPVPANLQNQAFEFVIPVTYSINGG